MVLSPILPLAMRLLLTLTLGLVLLGVGCAGPQSTGALWAQQNLDQEQASFRLGDAQRAELARAFELSLADEQVAGERQHIAADLQTCPGAPEPLGPSAGDRVRDGIRVQAQDDPTRLGELAMIALADWYTRRAAATGSTELCQRAQRALDGNLGGADSATPDLLQGLPVVTVSRDPSVSATPPSASATTQPLVTVSNYALGYLDTVQAPSPLPQYLAAVYGGSLQALPYAPLDAETAQTAVDRAAPAYPQWEPDALYAALRGGAWP